MQSEQVLVKKSMEGDTQAFEKLVLQYQNKVYALSFRYMGNEDDAYDMSQEVFLKAFRSLKTFKGNSSFGTWIFRITTNVCLDELRRRKRRIVPLSLDEAAVTSRGIEVEREMVDPLPPVDRVYEQKELSQYIQGLLDQMKPEHKAVIILRDTMDLSYNEIADVLKCSVGTVKSRLSRARSLLRKQWVQRELLP
ncbi:MAG: sigma-70 family RNA polymerase sigma factor [Syntrophomonas sp.]|uniref:RNA polymerase sigma factor n=1 Tax=Syntrophomonas sp. TaxID=2053627 RepID=UPI00260252D0|nr:sigma-70 family RNA polymerase sigma factor [Syntrophomonas sp.]MDD2509884.1 sigma-70 family RNA polymerase sigma factor [Syntrophomonas sp.]MDD3878571.1 sigma-70 family RNA polymerase sigma factor [Syntrophomonas sp.]MDD4626198.1 sigma-70 family RNA polymerase sigma factor [Syntrophomonas sp.]